MSYFDGNNYHHGYSLGYKHGLEAEAKDYRYHTFNLYGSYKETFCEGYNAGYHDGCLDRCRKTHGVYSHHDDD